MIKFLLYLLMLTALVPLNSLGRTKFLAARHPSEWRNKIIKAEGISPDTAGLIVPFVPFQDTVNTGGRKRIKEVGRSRPQAIPEKVERNEPDDRPADNPDRGNARPLDRPAAERTNVRPGGRPPGGMPGGVRPQAPPPRRGGR